METGILHHCAVSSGVALAILPPHGSPGPPRVRCVRSGASLPSHRCPVFTRRLCGSSRVHVWERQTHCIQDPASVRMRVTFCGCILPFYRIVFKRASCLRAALFSIALLHGSCHFASSILFNSQNMFGTCVIVCIVIALRSYRFGYCEHIEISTLFS